MKNNSFKEIKISFENKFYFTHCGITVRDYGERMSVVDSGSRNGVIAFEVRDNKELAEKIHSESLSLGDVIVVNPGATFISPLGDKIRTKERFILIPSKYDYNFKVKFDDGCLCPISRIDEEHDMFDSMKENAYFGNDWESYMSRFSRGGSSTEAAVFADGEQFYVEVEWSTMWQDNRPHAVVNGMHYVYDAYDGWKARYNASDTIHRNGGIMAFLDMFAEEDRRRYR